MFRKVNSLVFIIRRKFFWQLAILISCCLIFTQIGVLTGPSGWASNLEELKTKTGLNKTLNVANDMLSASETDLNSAEVYGWVQLPEKDAWSENNGKILVSKCMQNLVNQQPEGVVFSPWIWTENQQQQSLMVSCTSETNNSEIIKISAKNIYAPNKNNSAINTSTQDNLNNYRSIYLLIEVHKIASTEKAVNFREQAALVLKQTGEDSCGMSTLPVKTSLNLITSREGKLDHNQQQQIINKILKATGAGTSQGLNESNLISVTAYTSRIDEYQILAKQPVNLQVAARYHSLDQRTYFQIGIPLLMIEY